MAVWQLEPAGLLGLALLQAPAFASPALKVMDEPPIKLASIAGKNSSVEYGGTTIVDLVTSSPLLCANTSMPASPSLVKVKTTYYSAFGESGATPRAFVFGAEASTPSVSATASGGTSVSYDGNTLQFQGDPFDALVCYGLSTDGIRRVTPGVFSSDFDSVLYNSAVELSVLHLPISPNDYYLYTVDVTIPALPAGTVCNPSSFNCNFSLIEGYDTSIFDSDNGQWCLAPAGAENCITPPPAGGTTPVAGDINLNYSKYAAVVSLAAPIAPAPAKQYHFVAFRKLRSGVASIPISGAPVVMAALFSPVDLAETKLDDNVATGGNKLANKAPIIVQDGTYAGLAAKVSSLQEGTDSGTLVFDVEDTDTVESSGGPTLDAAVMLELPDGIQVPIIPACTLMSLPATVPVARSCAMNIPLNKTDFWNTSVGTKYWGQFSSVATDSANGIYASGVTANLEIIATDAGGASSSPVSIPVHVFPAKNDPPSVANVTGLQTEPDSKQGGMSYPTYSCSTSAGNCGGTFHVVELESAIATQAGPAAAFDELAMQTTAVNDVVCGLLGEVDPIFANSPAILPSAGSQLDFDVLFQLAPATLGSSLCKATFTDVTEGANQGAATADFYFRIEVNP